MSTHVFFGEAQGGFPESWGEHYKYMQGERTRANQNAETTQPMERGQCPQKRIFLETHTSVLH